MTANLILNINSQQSSTFNFNGVLLVSSNGNDGLYYGDSYKLAHTNWEVAGWLEFTLSVTTLIRSFLIFNREDCCYDESSFKITVGNSSPPSNNPTCYDFGVNV